MSDDFNNNSNIGEVTNQNQQMSNTPQPTDNTNQPAGNYSYSYNQINQGDSNQPHSNQQTYQSTQQAQPNQQAYQSTQQNQQYQWSPYESPRSKKKEKKEKKAPGFGNKLMKAACLALVFGLIAGASFRGAYYFTGTLLPESTSQVAEPAAQEVVQAEAPKKVETVATAIPVNNIASTSSDVSDIVEAVMPSIVQVTTVSVQEYRSFFGQVVEQESTSCGSGVIVQSDDSKIYIISNNHVVQGAEKLTVTFADDTAVDAYVKGTDPASDLAVIEVNLSDVPGDTRSKIAVVDQGTSSDVKVGQTSIVIGNALGYGLSVTTGVISALDRTVSLRDSAGNLVTNHLIQTEAAVNPGNSGGALLNGNGQLIGIVSAKYAEQSVEGMGYAIPIDYASNIFNEIINGEIISDEEAAYIGISGQDVNASISAQYGVPAGVYVSMVVSGSPAEKAGLKKGDIITSFNGRSVNSMESIQNYMKYIPAGTTVEIVASTVESEYSEEKTFTVTLDYRNKTY